MPDSIESLLSEARIARAEGRDEEFRRLAQLAVAMSLAENSPLLAPSLTTLAQAERDLDELPAAQENYQKAAAIYESDGEQMKFAHTIRHVADVALELKDFQQSEELYRRALQIYRESENTHPNDLANTIRGLALLQQTVGDRSEAILLWKEAESLYALQGIADGVAEASQRLRELS